MCVCVSIVCKMMDKIFSKRKVFKAYSTICIAFTLQLQFL